MDKNVIKEMVGNSPTIFEIGSADGLDTQEFLRVFTDQDFRIYCFEPDLRNISEFKKRINDNRAYLFEGVAGNTNGKTDFYTSLGENIYSSSLREPGELLYKTWPKLFKKNKSFSKTKVNSVKLDTFVENNNIGFIDFIWLDCQGAEDIVISGGTNTLANKVKFLYTEYSDQEIYVGEPNLNKILTLLPNYRLVYIQPNSNGDLLGGDVLLHNMRF